MTMQIQAPELEALILERMHLGAFSTAEEALLQALKDAPLPVGTDEARQDAASGPTGAVLVAAMQASPHKEINLEPDRARMPVGYVAF